MRDTYDVVVVGAGMVGMACALRLADSGLSVGLIERRAEVAHTFPNAQEPFDSRVVALSRAAEHLLGRVGVWEAISASRILPYQNMIVWDHVRDGQIHFSAEALFEPNLGYIVEQRVILSALWQKIRTHALVTCLFDTVVSSITSEEDRCANIHLASGACLKTSLLVGADGASSSIRQLLQIELSTAHYEQTAIVATVQGTVPHEAIAYQRFAEEGPLAWLPLMDPYLRSIVWSTTSSNAQWLCSLSAADFSRQLTIESDGRMGSLMLISDRISHVLQGHHAKEYALRRCVLIGDAAHTIHPLAGMGVNLGFLDVMVLANIIEDIHQAKRDIGLLPYLKRYERRRRWHNQSMLLAMSLFKKGFESRSPWLQWGRSRLLNAVDRYPTAKHFFMHWALAVDL